MENANMLPKRARLGFFLQLGRIFFDSVTFFNGYLSITKNGLIPEFFTLAQTFQNLAPIFGYLLSQSEKLSEIKLSFSWKNTKDWSTIWHQFHEFKKNINVPSNIIWTHCVSLRRLRICAQNIPAQTSETRTVSTVCTCISRAVSS